MDELIYNGVGSYYNALEKTGYMSYANMQKLLLLIFYRDFVFHDYRGLLSKEDYRLIERALDCLWGSTCLIPYPDYLKMGKLHLGEMTEVGQRLRNIENTKVVKVKTPEEDGTEAYEKVINDIEIPEDSGD
jgi:hypothetical protein